jgi:hypothetical protein
MYIDVESVRTAAALLTALTTIIGLIIALYRFFARQRKQDEELAAIRGELQVLCFGMRACLSGLKEQGCNGPVTQALDELEKHLNKKAHQGGDLA